MMTAFAVIGIGVSAIAVGGFMWGAWQSIMPYSTADYELLLNKYKAVVAERDFLKYSTLPPNCS